MTASIFLLDTNTAAYILSGRSAAARTAFKATLADAVVAVSAITQAEILFGLENKPGATRLRAAIEDFLGVVQILPWDSAAAHAYSRLRARLAAAGKSLSALDMLIAAHAVATNALLVTHDNAFQHATPFIHVVDWATDL